MRFYPPFICLWRIRPCSALTLDVAPYIARLHQEIDRVNPQEMRMMADLIFQAWQDEKFVFIFGNGGSGTTATHMSEDLGKSSLRDAT